MRTTLAILAAAASAVSGYQWSQAGGGKLRSNVWPTNWNGGNVGEEEPLFDAFSVPNLSQPIEEPQVTKLGDWPFTLYNIKALEYETPSTFKLEKTPPPLVMSTGTVVFSTDEGLLLGLPNPDTPGANWASPTWTQQSSVDDTAKSNCYDAVLDSSDTIYQAVRHGAQLKSYVMGYSTRGSNTPVPLSWSPTDLQSDMRILELYHIGMILANGKLFVPTSPTLSNEGLAIVDTGSGVVQTVKDMGVGGQDSMTGSVYIPSSGLVAGLLDHGNNAKGTGMYAFDANGVVKWSSTAQFVADIDQPNPIIDPYTGYIYWIGVHGSSADGDAPISIFCAMGNSAGAPCPTWPSNGKGKTISNTWGSSGTTKYSVEWVFQGSLVPNVPEGKVDRILFSFTLSGGFSQDTPTGCVLAVDPAGGSVQDSYCVPRDKAGLFAGTNYLATSPLVALNARGTGQHTALIAQYDCIVLAFDPYNLAQGPLYTADPLPVDDLATVSGDFLSMTSGGSLLMTAWDDTNNEFSVLALPGVLTLSPGGGANNAPKSGSISPGGAATLSIFLIGFVGVGVATYLGYLPAVSKALSSVVAKVTGGGYSSIGSKTAAYSSTGSAAASSGSYGSASSASAPTTFNGGGYSDI